MSSLVCTRFHWKQNAHSKFYTYSRRSYVWSFRIDCFSQFFLQIHQHFSLFSSLPQIVCLAFLSFQYPLLLFKGFTVTEQNKGSEVSFHQPVCCTVYTLATSRSKSECCLGSNETNLFKKKHLKKPFLQGSIPLYVTLTIHSAFGAHTVRAEGKRGVQLRMPVA